MNDSMDETITIILAPETTIDYKLGYYRGFWGAMGIPGNSYYNNAENYWMGYADGYVASMSQNERKR